MTYTPVQLTLVELVRELTATPEGFASGNRIEMAVRQLRGGPAHHHGQCVLPTRAVLRAMELGVEA